MISFRPLFFLVAFAATGAESARTGDGWGFIFNFVEQLRTDCQTTINNKTETWKSQETTCSYQSALKKVTIDSLQGKYQSSRNMQEREESKANSHANTVAQLKQQLSKTENEKATLLHQITKGENDFNSLDAEYVDNVAVIQKAIQFNMEQMDKVSCIPKTTETITNNADSCEGVDTESTCTVKDTDVDGVKDCRWERPASLTKIQKMLNTLQDKFRTERIHNHNDYLQLVHKQQLAKLAMTQIITAVSAQITEASAMQNGSVVIAAEEKIKARQFAVEKDAEQETLTDLQVTCKLQKEAYSDAFDAHAKCTVEVEDMSKLVQQNMESGSTGNGCAKKPEADVDEAACAGYFDEDGCEADPGCHWTKPNDALLFVQLGTETDGSKANPMELLHRAGKFFGDRAFINLLQGPGEVDAPVPEINPADPDWSDLLGQICPAITNLVEARVGCDLANDEGLCSLGDQAHWHCEERTCTTKIDDASQDDQETCAALTTKSSCEANSDTCQVSETKSCEEDLNNVRNERTNLSVQEITLQNQASLLLNKIATKEAEIQDKRDCRSAANFQNAVCVSDKDQAEAVYEADRFRTKMLLENSQKMIETVHANFGSELADATSTAALMMASLMTEQGDLNFERLAQEGIVDAARVTHANCQKAENIKHEICKTREKSLEEESAQLEHDRAVTIRMLGETKKIWARTNRVESTMDASCLGKGGRLEQCVHEFSHTVEDLENAYNILSCS